MIEPTNKIETSQLQLRLSDMITIEQFIIEGQGAYSGYFQYEGKRVVETFSLLLRRALPENGESRTTLELVGYG